MQTLPALGEARHLAWLLTLTAALTFAQTHRPARVILVDTGLGSVGLGIQPRPAPVRSIVTGRIMLDGQPLAAAVVSVQVGHNWHERFATRTMADGTFALLLTWEEPCTVVTVTYGDWRRGYEVFMWDAIVATESPRDLVVARREDHPSSRFCQEP